MILLGALPLPPPESDLDDEQIRDMLASPLVPTGERSKCRPTTSLSLLQRKLYLKLITLPSKRGKTCSDVLTQKKVESRRISLRHRRHSLWHIEQLQGENEALSRLSELESDTRLFVEGQRNQCLSEARSETLKQECRAERADCACYSSTSKANSVQSYGSWPYWPWIRHITKRSSQASWRMSATRKCASSNSYLKYSGSVEELKRAQEIRIDEFSRQELRESLLSARSPPQYRNCKTEWTLWTTLGSSKMSITRHWTPAQVLPHLHLLCCFRLPLRLQACCPRIHLPTAGWHFCGVPTSHRLWAQKGRAQQDPVQTIKPGNWRPGWYWGNWCQTVVQQPIIDTLSVRFGREHCNATRLGPRRRTPK